MRSFLPVCLLVNALFLLLLLLCPLGAGAAGPSTYTDLYGKTCQAVDSTARASSRLCRGPAGYALVVYDSDERASVDIVTPDNALFPLSFWDVVTPGYSALGQKAEWLMARRKGKPAPAALLVRLNRLDAGQAPQLIAAARLRLGRQVRGKCLGPLGADLASGPAG